MKKEVKAQDYAGNINLGLTGFPKEIAVCRSYEDYLVGYNQAEKDISAQTIAYKEVLKNLIIDCQILLNRSNRLNKELYSLTEARKLIESENEKENTQP